VKLFIKYYLHRFLPTSLLDINKFISKKFNKYKDVNFKDISKKNNIKINENSFEDRKLFMLAKKKD